MKKWPLNSTTFFAATHSKLRKAADGTDTLVATCMINKWTTKINENEIYNGKCPPRERREKNQKEKEGRQLQFLPPLKAFANKHQRTEKKKNQPEDKILLFFHTFDHPISLWSCPAVGALAKAQFLSPFSLPNLLYWVRWVWAHFPNSKEPPKSAPYNNILVLFKS